MHGIALNFFPLVTDQFTITLYRLPYVERERPTLGSEQAVRRNLEVEGKRDFYWTLFQQIENGIKTECEPFENVYVTIDALRMSLIRSCKDNLDCSRFRFIEGIRQRVEITTKEHREGKQVILLEPYLLRSRGQFGYLADFRFRPTKEHRGTQAARELSLSLDKYGQRNSSYYADRYSHLDAFVKRFHSKIFPVTLPGGTEVQVGRQLAELPSEQLDVKHYVVGSGLESRSQFMGVKREGPFTQGPKDAHLYFLFREQDRPLSRDLFRALRGDTFQTFSGMESMFRVAISNESVSGVALTDFSDSEIRRIRDQVVADAAGRKIVPIFLTPFSKDDEPKKNEPYWRMKHAFLSEKLPIQVVASETVANKNKLKWATAGIGLQVFAKLGGTPWKVRPRTERCLIVGIGQAHHNSKRGIERFFAYSVLTDSSGVFEEVRVLGEAQKEEDYIRSFSANLRKIFSDYSDRFTSFVVHATFSIRQRELESIASTLSERRKEAKEGEFVSLKFNERRDLFGFAVEHNSLVPYESSLVQLAHNEFLIWFEGLQYGQPGARGMVEGPLHVKFTYPTNGLTPSQQESHLQDAINLSGANWRGFNAKSLPVSVFYAQIIARYLKEFERLGLPKIDVNVLTPWFL